MLEQIKKTLRILLIVCFLMPVTAAAASAHGGGWVGMGWLTLTQLQYISTVPVSVPAVQEALHP
jgi:hypothetical protein